LNGQGKEEKKASTINPTSLTPNPSTASPPPPLRMERGVNSTVCWGLGRELKKLEIVTL